MGFTVEDGSVVTGANSYVSLADADAYHEDRRNTSWTSVSSSPDQGKEAALVRATQYIDAMFGSQFPGDKVAARSQSLQWPRMDAFDAEGEEISDSEVPIEVKNAVCEAALRELASPGSLMPDLERGGEVKRLKAGSVEVEYSGTASATTTFQAVEAALRPLMRISNSRTQLFARASKG